MPSSSLPGVRAVAILEAAKGFVVVAAGLGLLSLVHHDFQRIAEGLVAHAHLDPASHYPRIFIDAAAALTDARLHLLAAGAAAYSGLRFAEAWGLWRGRAWAEWLAALSGGLYIPFEVIGIVREPGGLGFALLAVNVGVVGIMAASLRRRLAAARSP
jgi:uncharacterized membrane protein (DUF2068 family)